MKLLKTICAILGAAVLILAFSTDLSLEGCGRPLPTQDELVETGEDLLNPQESPKYYKDQAVNDARNSGQRIGDEARQTGEDLVNHGRNIGQEAVNGTVRTTKNATRSYFGFLGNIIKNIKEDWHNFLLQLGFTENEIQNNRYDNQYTPDYDEMGNRQHQRLRDAWEGRNTGYTTSKNTITDDNTEMMELPNSSDSVKKKIYRLPSRKYNFQNAGWINC